MTSHIGEALRKAARLTRLGQLGEATKLIQAALGRQPSRAAAEPPAESSVSRPKHSRSQRVVLPLGQTIELLRQRRPERPLPGRPAPEPAVPPGARFEARTYASAAGSRGYRLFVPSGAPRRRPLLVMLHGCTQNPDDFAVGTGMNDLAQAEQVFVVYPGQASAANQSYCWNWFNRQDQERGSGEPSILAGLTRELIQEFDSDPRGIFVAGLSAGGAMAAVMGATYPDLYCGLGIHSGLPYGSATDVASAFSTMRGGAHVRLTRPHRVNTARPRTIVFHGAADTTVNPVNGERIVDELESCLADPRATLIEGKSAGGRTYRRRLVYDGGSTWAEHWVIDGVGHAWSGGNPLGSYTDPTGPDASSEMLRFFLRPDRLP
jgi:poly(hydroxyalkanoate) depolymerase family esterase